MEMQISKAKIRNDVSEIISDGDLSQLSSKKVRKSLETLYSTDLSHRKKEIDDILMEVISENRNVKKSESSNSTEHSCGRPAKDCDSKDNKSDSDSEFEAPDDTEPVQRKAKHRTTKANDSSESEVDDEALAKQLQDEEENGGRRKTRGGGNRKTAPVKRKAKRKQSAADDGAPKKKTAYSQECQLSPALAAIMDTEKMARSDVVKRMWEIVRERDLMDPKNRQFMLCDAELQKVFGRKRVRTFGMMKYLKDHMFTPEDY